MSRKIVIDKYQGNTLYGVSVFDSYGTEHHLGYVHTEEIDEIRVNPKFKNAPNYIRFQAEKIWENEVKPEENSLSNAISECVKLDEERGVEPNLD
tara:strand:+ start:282 stop:566 length:285 start_codon:yes stop_codon:yes gene_type:complete